jgi:hypothetical protein
VSDQTEYGDPLSIPFWWAAQRHELMVQRCAECGQHQFYPRPFCLACFSDDISWVVVSGEATVYSQTTVVMAPAPYTVALVDLAEGPRLTTLLVGDSVEIGDPVRLSWQEREDAPPLPVFTRVSRSEETDRRHTTSR